LNSLGRTILLASALAACALAGASCGVTGDIGDPPRSGGTGTGAGGPPLTGAAGTSSATGSSTGTGAGSGTGVAGSGSSGSGAAGSTGTGTGTAGTGSSGTGTAGTGTTTGAAGATSTGSAGSGTAGTGTTTGAAGATSTGTAGVTGAAGTGSLPPVMTPHCKRGEAYGSNSLADLTALSKGISWWYNWSTSPDKGVATTFQQTGVEFVPMVWGIKGGLPDPATIEKQIPKGAKYILGFNEPNFASQSNIPAAQAASLWPRIMQIAKDLNLKIGSPAPNYCAGACNDTDPIHYLDTFFAACTGCQVDFIAAHWYACDGPALTHYLGLLKKYGKPIWLTEFSCMDAGDHSVAGEEAYMKTALQILENDPMIFRYSWFTGRWTNPAGVSLLAGDGQLTELGNQYITTPATGVCGQ
jgi:hypothetical protein